MIRHPIHTRGSSRHWEEHSVSLLCTQTNSNKQVTDSNSDFKRAESFDDDKMIPVFGFGDIRTRDKAVFPFYEDRLCYTFSEVLERYIELTPLLSLSGSSLSPFCPAVSSVNLYVCVYVLNAGPTNFAPLIRKAIDIVKESKEYHILIIIADGQVDKAKETVDAIVQASNFPLSIIMVGVGDGPWDQMREFVSCSPFSFSFQP